MKHAVLAAILVPVSLLATPSLVSAAPFTNGPTLEMGGGSHGAPRDTFLRFMETRVKPAMDTLATDGYAMCSRTVVGEAYAAADSKVRWKVDGFGGIANVKKIVDKLIVRLNGRKVTLATLPAEIGAVAPSVNRYDLATFLGLACGGGVRVGFDEGYYSVNVHYDVTEERSGRSFGVGESRGANDASDKAYLDDLEAYSRASGDDLPDFYAALFGSLLATDNTGFAVVEDEGKMVLTDFLAVYIAEQARNLMDGHVSPHWDAALLEVTLLAGFHAGQSELKLYYKNASTGSVTFTDRTFRQQACAVPSSPKDARLNDYWQFSRNIQDAANCRRSGINITNGEFRKLGTAITRHVRENHPATYARVKASMDLSGSPTNLYNSLSKYLISTSAPRTMTAAKAASITAAWLEMLEIVTADADVISATL